MNKTGAAKNGTRSKRPAGQPNALDSKGPAVRIVQRTDHTPGPAVRIMLANAGRGDVDLTRSFTGAIAHALWMARGGEDTANWVEAEHLLEQVFNSLAERPERKSPTRLEPVSGPLPEPPFPGARRELARTQP